jgi:copper(I)-binding protein
VTARIARTGPLSALVRPSRRAATVAALVAGGALALSACSAGQISQTAEQVASVNGNFANVGEIALRNVHVAYPDAEEYTNSKGGKAALAFVAINSSPDSPDKLTAITTDAGKVVVTPAGPAEIAPQRALIAEATGTAVTEEELATEESKPLRVEVTDLERDLTPGLTIPVTFDFEHNGSVTVQVPVDAGADTPRYQSEQSGAGEHPAEAAQQGEGGGH